MRYRTSDLRISRCDALPQSHRDSTVSEVYYEVHMTGVLHTVRDQQCRQRHVCKQKKRKLTIFLILFTNMTLSTLLILAVCRTRFIGTGGWLHCHLNAKGCASARDKCNLDPHCCPGRRGPASAGPNAFPGEILELKKSEKKNQKGYEHVLIIRFRFREPKQAGFQKKKVCSPSAGGEKSEAISGGHTWLAPSTGARIEAGGGHI